MSKFSLICNDYDLVKGMINSGEIECFYSFHQNVDRLYRYFVTVDGLSYEDAFDKVCEWLSSAGEPYSMDVVQNICNNATTKDGVHELKRINEPIRIYESDVELLDTLPNEQLKRIYFTMMVYNKIRKANGKDDNKLFHSVGEYYNYNSSRSLKNDEQRQAVRYLFQNGYIDCPLDELYGLYYTGTEETGQVVYEITKGFDSKNFQKHYDIVVGKPIMVIDLTVDKGHVIYNSVGDYVDEVPVDRSNLDRVLKHDKFRLDTYTYIEVPKKYVNDKQWLDKAECIQRSLEPHYRKIKKLKPFINDLLSGDIESTDIDWIEVYKQYK